MTDELIALLLVPAALGVAAIAIGQLEIDAFAGRSRWKTQSARDGLYLRINRARLSWRR